MGVRMMMVVAALAMLAGCGEGDTPGRTQASLDQMWSTYSDSQRDALCAQLDFEGVDRVVDIFMADAPDMDRETVRQWWIDACRTR